MKKLFSLLIVLTLILGCAISCGELTAEEVMKNATEEMAETPCKITMDMNFSSSNQIYHSIFSQMSMNDLKIEIDGNDMHFNMNMDAGVAQTSIDYTVFNGTLYMKTFVSASGETQTVKQKAQMTEADVDNFLSDMNLSQDMELNFFSDVTMTKDGDTYVITGKGATAALNKALGGVVDVLEESLDEIISIDYAEYVLKIKDNKFTSAKLICTYSIMVQEQEIQFTMTSDMTYDYDAQISISAPADASTYDTVDYEDLVA